MYNASIFFRFLLFLTVSSSLIASKTPKTEIPTREQMGTLLWQAITALQTYEAQPNQDNFSRVIKIDAELYEKIKFARRRASGYCNFSKDFKPI